MSILAYMNHLKEAYNQTRIGSVKDENGQIWNVCVSDFVLMTYICQIQIRFNTPYDVPKSKEELWQKVEERPQRWTPDNVFKMFGASCYGCQTWWSSTL